MRGFTILGVLLAAAGLQAQQAPEAWARYRVWAHNDAEIQKLSDSDFGLFSDFVGPVTDIVVKSSQLAELKSLGLEYAFVNLLEDPRDWASKTIWSLDYRTAYMRYSDILAQYEAWRNANPKMISRQQIGTSVQNRPIWMYRLHGAMSSDGSTPRFSVVFFAGIHAREWISEPVVMYLLDNLVQKSKTSPAIRQLLNSCSIYFIPVLNPDGYEYTWTNDRYWRKNRRNNGGGSYGVDLNRNFSKGFGGGGSSGNTNSDTYRGPSAFSEPETRALRDAVLAIPRVRGLIDFHSYAQIVLWPWGYTGSAPPTATELDRVGAIMQNAIFGSHGVHYDEGQCYWVLYQASGVSMDWSYDLGVPYSYSIELRDTGQYGFELPANQIIPTQEEIYAAVEQFLFQLQSKY
jgi:murein tripeptide amidase MpaA